jgi:hypothetical protein
MCFILETSKRRYTIVMISNLPAIILIIRNIFEIIFIFIDVIPVERPVVVTAETDSKRESKRFF